MSDRQMHSLEVQCVLKRMEKGKTVCNVDHMVISNCKALYRVLRVSELTFTLCPPPICLSPSPLSVGWQQCSVHRTGGVSQRHSCAALRPYELC